MKNGSGTSLAGTGTSTTGCPLPPLPACYDLLNSIITAVQFHTRHTAEIIIAMNSISQVPKDVLMVYDRGYASHAIPYLHQHFGSNCVIRMPVGFSNTIKALVASGRKGQVITERLSGKAFRSLIELGVAVNRHDTITCRLVRATLPNGQAEVLLTTLLDTNCFKHAYFAEIYKKRCGIESCFFALKSFFQLANFSAYTTNNCWADIYAHFILYNIQTALFTTKVPEIRKVNKQRRHGYKPNRNVTAGLLNRFLVKFTLRPLQELDHWLQGFYRQLLQTMEPIRPGKNKERLRRALRGTERHVHEKNYRPAL